jgi:hypothetical protein
VLFTELVFHFSADSIGDELVRYEENFPVTAICCDHFTYIRLNLGAPILLGAKCERLSFAGGLPSDTGEPDQR